ncbi:MAG: extracellular solute-binding protein [Ardenticatenaceae bacterium]|nr:extracellular solute-binding protein [Ardenticatenaceae bacterium]MCB9443283.1 extracellular solute-binding protein [Ardenticatenaceae bacterium]
MQHKHTILLLWLLLLLSACDLISNNANEPLPTATATAAPAATPILQSTPAIAVPTVITQTAPSLTIWLPPNTVLGSEDGTAVFSDQLLTFNAVHPELETRVEQKTISGPGGILSYLRTGSTVAPSILPDVIVLPANLLKTAVTDGLVYPLDDLIEPALFDDLFPAAQTMSQVNDQHYGYPFAITNLTHLAYQTTVITTTPPLRWDVFAENPAANFVFPAAGTASARLALQFYLAGGGSLTNEAGQPALDPALMTQALLPFQQGRMSDFILLQSSNMDSFDKVWELFGTGTAVYILTDVNHFLLNRSPEMQPGYAVTPGLTTPLIPLVDGWVWAISTNDPTRRALAAELIAHLIDGDRLGLWSQASQQLPARRQALTNWPRNDAYISFVQLELERAQASTTIEGEPIMTAFANAVFDVISFAKTAQEAASEATAALQP